MNIIGMTNYKPVRGKRNSILGLLGEVAASFGMGMSREWSKASDSR